MFMRGLDSFISYRVSLAGFGAMVFWLYEMR